MTESGADMNTTGWFKKGSVYQINPRTFSEEGTLKSIEKELPFLSELGFTAIYLCPIFTADDSEDRKFWSTRQKASKTENPKNPYRMNNYYTIDEEYGTMEDLRDLVAKAHEAGLKVILDLVYLHIGPNADILKIHPEFAQKNPDGSTRLTKWNFPYVNFDNEGLREYLWGNMVYYIGAIDVDGFRCDVGDQVPLDFWKEGIRRIKMIKPDCFMIDEGRNPQYLEVFDTNYAFFWHERLFKVLEGESTAAEAVRELQEVHASLPEGGLLLMDMDNHDTVTDWPYRVEEHFGHDAMECIQVLNHMLPGVPMVYCGNELADTAKLNMFANRFHMGAFEVTDRSKKDTPESIRRQKVYQKLNYLRREESAVSDGSLEWISNADPDALISFARKYGENRFVYVGNFSNRDVKPDIDLQGEIVMENLCNADTGYTLKPYGYIVIKED